MTKNFPILPLLTFLAACGDPVSQPKPQDPPSPTVAALMLAREPANAIEVNAAKAKGPADQVTVTGRLYDITPGRAQLKLMDLSLPYCGEKNKEDNCKTPWDYCCDLPHIPANTLVVEARDADGKALVSPSLGDLRLLDKVAVTGKLTKDEHGNFTLLATGWFRQQRPELPADLRWPQ